MEYRNLLNMERSGKWNLKKLLKWLKMEQEQNETIRKMKHELINYFKKGTKL